MASPGTEHTCPSRSHLFGLQVQNLYHPEEDCLLMSKHGASLVAQMVLKQKNLPARRETRFQILDHVDPLEEGMATHSSILAWKIPWTEEPGRPWSMELQRVGRNWATFTFKHILVYPPAPWKMQKVGACRSTYCFFISTLSPVKCGPALDSIHFSSTRALLTRWAL